MIEKIKEFLYICLLFFIYSLPVLIILAIVYLIAVSDLPFLFKWFLLK